MKVRKVAAGVPAMIGLVVSFGVVGCNGTDQPMLSSDSSVAPVTPTQGSDTSQDTPPAEDPSTTPSPAPTTDIPTGSDLYTGPAEVEKYVTRFVSDALIQGVDVLPQMKNPKLEIRLASLDAYGSTTIGLCETSGGQRRVTFDPDFWDNVDETQRELVAHHELGHCVLYRGHTTSTLSSGAVASIMYPVIMSNSTYLGNYAYYQKELFTQSLTSSSALASETATTHVCTSDGM